MYLEETIKSGEECSDDLASDLKCQRADDEINFTSAAGIFLRSYRGTMELLGGGQRI
ncbi:uncharacterized protein PHALS_02247 [Plasmopara halstedii]|uniref:Uncharacterized protein n=1 Tax=Plasmopara halstedii TaxID=4781 RepID=A0A0P1AYH5_PLAHL|nr:uncharacterized protein PHALS_02247 [Plasmopara halstedii]CEG45914.1 hypothetical protein PHALS_02247 [Plasmopara halstedii]|eukprot:XP_024582283.1 hypothetical protein PHALS_02247 [Plasmopara halstedii]